MMVKELGYDFDSLYIGGGTPTIMIDELCDFIDLAKREFSIKEVSCETNPNHLIPSYLDKLQGRVDRLSVGVRVLTTASLSRWTDTINTARARASSNPSRLLRRISSRSTSI